MLDVTLAAAVCWLRTVWPAMKTPQVSVHCPAQTSQRASGKCSPKRARNKVYTCSLMV